MPPPNYVNHFPNPKTNVTGNSATPRRTASTIGTVGGIITTTTSNAMASSAPAPPAENKHPSSGILPQTPQRYVESLTNKVVYWLLTHPSIVFCYYYYSGQLVQQRPGFSREPAAQHPALYSRHAHRPGQG